MKSQKGDGEFLVVILLVVTIVAILTLIMALISAKGCQARWEKSGMLGTSWGFMTGCMVQTPDGRWLPQGAIRQIDPYKAPEKKQ